MQQLALTFQPLAIDQVRKAQCSDQGQCAGSHHQTEQFAQGLLVIRLLAGQLTGLNICKGLHLRANTVHETFAPATRYQLQNFSACMGLSQFNNLCQFRHLGIHQGRQLLQGIRAGVGFRQLLKLLQAGRNTVSHGKIGLQKIPIARDHVAALSRFGIFERRKKICRGIDHQKGVPLGTEGNGYLLVGSQTKADAGQQEHCRQA